jgi:hypothetical protein
LRVRIVPRCGIGNVAAAMIRTMRTIAKIAVRTVSIFIAVFLLFVIIIRYFFIILQTPTSSTWPLTATNDVVAPFPLPEVEIIARLKRNWAIHKRSVSQCSPLFISPTPLPSRRTRRTEALKRISSGFPRGKSERQKPAPPQTATQIIRCSCDEFSTSFAKCDNYVT